MNQLAILIAQILDDGIIDKEEVVLLKAEILDDGIVDIDEIVATFEMARKGTDNSDGALFTLMRDMVVDRFLGDDGEITDDEMVEIEAIFHTAASLVTESERQILYVVRTAANAVCVAFESFCAERKALEL